MFLKDIRDLFANFVYTGIRQIYVVEANPTRGGPDITGQQLG